MTYRPGPPPKDWAAVYRELQRISDAVGDNDSSSDAFSVTFGGAATAAMGVPYLGALTPSGTYSLASGTLPPGLSIVDSRLIGFLYEAGLYTFTLNCTDETGRVGSGETTINVYGNLSGIELRKAQIAAKAAGEAVPEFTGSGKYVHGNVEARLKCDITDQDALDALEVTTTVDAYQKNQFGAMSTARLYVQFKGQLPTDLQSQMLASAKDNVKFQYAIGTENINLMRKCAGILFGESEPSEVFAWDNGTDTGTKTGAQMAADLKGEFLEWAQAMWSNNEWEFRSPVYSSVSQVALSTLITYSTDTEVVSAAQLLFDHLAHNVHIHSINNVIFPGKRNRTRYAGTPQGDIPEWGTQWTDWIYFGSEYGFVPRPEHANQRSAYLAALDEAKPSAWVLNYAPTTPFTAYFRGASSSYTHPDYVNDISVFDNTLSNLQASYPPNAGHNFTKAYITDHYTLADGKYYDTYALEGYDDYFGCWWKSKSATPRIIVSHPFTNWSREVDGVEVQDDDWNMESPFKSSGQRANVQAIIFDIVEPNPYASDITLAPYIATTMHEAFYIYVPDELAYKTTENDIRYYQDGDIYVGIKCTVTPTVETTRWEGYSKLKVSGALEGMWLAIGHADEYGSFGDFRIWFNGATFTDNLGTTGTLSYSNAGATLDVVKHNGSYPLLPTVTIDSVAEDCTAWNRREWPGLIANNGFQLFCEGTEQVTVQNWSQKERADFWLWETNIAVTGVSSDTLSGSVPADNEARLYTSTAYYDVDDFDLTIDSTVVPSGVTITEVRVYRPGDRPTEFVSGDESHFTAGIGSWYAGPGALVSHDAVNGWMRVELNSTTSYWTGLLQIDNLVPRISYTLSVDFKYIKNKGALFVLDETGTSGHAYTADRTATGVETLTFEAETSTHIIGIRCAGGATAICDVDDITLREVTQTRPNCP